MTLVDIWAATAAFIAGSNVLLRAYMLRPHQRKWVAAPLVVCLALSICALALVMCGISIVYGSHANSREGLVYSIQALGSFVLLWNLGVNGKQADARRQKIKDEVDLVLGLSGPPAPMPGERR